MENCPNCGARLGHGYIRCPNCGYTVANSGPVFGRERPKMSACAIVALVIVALICAFGGVCFVTMLGPPIMHSSPPPPVPPKPKSASATNSSAINKILDEGENDK